MNQIQPILHDCNAIQKALHYTNPKKNGTVNGKILLIYTFLSRIYTLIKSYMFPHNHPFSIIPFRRSLRNLKRAMNPQPQIRQSRRRPINSQPLLAATRARGICILRISPALDSRDSDSKLIRSQARLSAIIQRA